MAGERICPHCQAPNPLDVNAKCVRCRKLLPAYCFSCYAAIPDEEATACAACGRGRWVFGDFAELPCAFEGKGRRRQHRYMTTLMKAGKAVHEWRCMTCFSDDTHTEAFAHFPDRPLAEV